MPTGGRMVTASSQVRPVQLNSLEEMWRFGGFLASSGMLPSSYLSKKEQENLKGEDLYNVLRSKAVVAIQLGAEVGLMPMQAVQSIYVVNGMPTLWGDGQLAVVRQSGLLEYIKEWSEGEAAAMVCHCEVKRKGDPDPIRRSFSWQDAIKAKLAMKDTYQQHPARMCGRRCRAFALRDAFPDALKGLTHTYEEMVDVTPEADRHSKPVAAAVDDMTTMLAAEADAVTEETPAEDTPQAEGAAVVQATENPTEG